MIKITTMKYTATKNGIATMRVDFISRIIRYESFFEDIRKLGSMQLNMVHYSSHRQLDLVFSNIVHLSICRTRPLVQPED
uniref:Uncharacterized protein n=1 Tax=Glossina palpalis gambiensis TaxID=67801 RepID=A0A1B0AMI3_9MUSC